jgi:hypothetical protein
MREAAEALLLQAAAKSRKERRLEFRPRRVAGGDKVDLSTVQNDNHPLQLFTSLVCHQMTRPKRPKSDLRQDRTSLQSPVRRMKTLIVQPISVADKNSFALHQLDKSSQVGFGSHKISRRQPAL